MKKKLEDAYIPDKQGQKEKIVLGLSGGIDSSVTAYLLKIQKYDLIAVTIVNSWEELPGDQQKAFSCHITPTKLESIKEFCHRLSVPLHIFKAPSEFKENVVEPWMADKVLGRKTKTCWDCHELRMGLLYEKMKEFGAHRMATGHYAKLFHNENHDSVFVHTGNDEQHDQSSLLSRLPHEILNSLVLPLSDLTRKEVVKLGENFGISEDNKAISIHQCLGASEDLHQLLDKKIPKKLIREGEMTNADGTENFGEHQGVHLHTFGEALEVRAAGKATRGIFGEYSYQEKKMVIMDENFFVRNKLLLTKCRFSEEVSWIEPVKGHLNLSHDKSVECWIHPKSLNSVYLELSEEAKLLNGDIVTVVKKKGKNSKVYLTGEIQLLPQDPVQKEGEQSVPKVNYSIDF